MLAMAGDLNYSEQVSALITADARARLDALARCRRDDGLTRWPDYSLGAVLRDVIQAGLDVFEKQRGRTS
jgi:hypothetical protein